MDDRTKRSAVTERTSDWEGEPTPPEFPPWYEPPTLEELLLGPP